MPLGFRSTSSILIGCVLLANRGALAQPHPASGNVALPVGGLSLGHVQTVAKISRVNAALGIRGSVGFFDPLLDSRYGTRAALGVMAYMQVQPAVMNVGR